MKTIHVEFECRCNTCGHEDSLHSLENTAAQIEIIEATSFNNFKGKKEGASSVSMPSALNKHTRTASAVSFAQNVKEGKEELPQKASGEEHDKHIETKEKRVIQDDNTIDLPLTSPHSLVPKSDFKLDESDNSTLSTDDEESATNLMEDNAVVDGEITFLRGFMSTHATRQGIARYAIKRARSDLRPDEILESVVDLAVEARFLATMRHPNIVRMRGTVGTPGTEGFMIVMDRLQMTLREKMVVWNCESKGKRPSLLGKLLGNTSKAAVQREQYADKLLAVYDIARAMRYLHKNM